MTAVVEQPTHRTLISWLATGDHRFTLIILHKIQLQMELMNTLNLKEEKVRDNFEVVVTGKEFLNRTLHVKALRTPINK